MTEKEFFNSLPKKRMGAAALLFNSEGKFLLERPSYKDRWMLAGGTVEADESPRAGCIREIREELNIDIERLEFLCVDYYPAKNDQNERLEFLFTAGVFSPEQVAAIRPDGKEILEFRFVTLEEAVVLMGGDSRGSVRRLRRGLAALRDGRALYLEEAV